MTFTTMVKDEISKQEINSINAIPELSSFIRFDALIKKDEIVLTIENASVARRIYKLLKSTFSISPKITVRIQKRFRIKQIYLLTITEKITNIMEALNIYIDGKKTLPEEYFLSLLEDKISFLRGLFLSSGSITNPQTGNYHLEFSIPTKKESLFIIKLLNEFQIVSKTIKRKNNYMVYIKSSEMISDILKMFNATNSLFFFEDIRIYRDHKNMVNRLNNCEIANQEKTIETGLKQLEDIKYLKKYDLITLLDDRIKEVISYREKYPETSYQQLAEIVSQETNIPISKSGINHYFRKIKDLINKHKSKNSR